MNRKAQVGGGYENAIDIKSAIIFLFIAAIAAVAFRFVIADGITEGLVTTPDTETFLQYETMRNCFLHKENDRVYYHTINLEKVNKGNITNCLPNTLVRIQVYEDDTLLKEEFGDIMTSYSQAKRYPINIHGKSGSFTLVVSLV